MVRTIDICGKDLEDYRTIVPRATFDVETALHDVVGVCDAVRDRGEEALREFSERFDHVVSPHLRVPTNRLDQALADLDRGKVVSVPTPLWKLFIGVASHAPRSAMRFLSRTLSSSRDKDDHPQTTNSPTTHDAPSTHSTEA